MELRFRKPSPRRNGLAVFVILIFYFSFIGLINTSNGSLDQTSSELLLTAANQLNQQGISYLSNTPTYYNSSVTGNLHVFFHHYTFVMSYADSLLYHIYELENGSWSLPKLVFGYEEFSSLDVLDDRGYLHSRIMAIGPSIEGFTLYINYDSPHKIGISAIEYDENSQQWLDQKEVFGINYMEDYLRLTTPLIGLEIHSLFLDENNSFYVVWGYIDQTDYNSRYIITKVDQEGSYESQQITGKTVYIYNSFPMVFYKDNNTLNLYESNLRYRTILFSNGSWSKWENATLASNYGFFPNFFPNPWSDNNFVEGQYYFGRDNANGKEICLFYDLAQEDQLQQRTLTLPYSPYYTIDDDNPNIGFELNVSTSDELLFVMGLMTNETLELWQYNATSNRWKQISLLEINASLIIRSCSEHYSLEVIKDKSDWRIFWGESCGHIGNLYTTTYDAESKKWGSVICIMNASTIYTDYYDYIQNSIPGLEFLVSIFCLVTIIVAIRNIRTEQ